MKTKVNLFRSLMLVACAPLAANANNIDVIGSNTHSANSFASTNNGIDGGLGTNIRIINGTNVTWTKNNTYFVTDKLFIPKGATLTIEPGTKVYFSSNNNSTPTVKTDDKVGAITACRGGKLIANGTAAEPIVFTSVREWEALNGVDSPFDPDLAVGPAPTAADAGQWGGIILLGQAFTSFVNNTGVNAGTVQIEGFAPAGSSSYDGDSIPDATQYGVSTNFPLNNDDNSGSLRYCSIRHGGYEFDAGKEINGLTLGAVGSGTTIEYIEVYANQDDGIEFFGGTVNTRNIVMAFNQDDSFDIDEGYRGINQFWFAIQNPGAADAGGEWDGVGGTSAGYNLGDPATNHANPIIYNATFIGAGRANTLSQLPLTTGSVNWEKGNFALHIEDYFAGEIYNSVFDDYAADLIKYNDNTASTSTKFKFKHNTIGRFGSVAQKQIETATVTVGTVSTGTLALTVTGTGITGSPRTVNVSLTAGDSRATVTEKIRAAIAATTQITALYDVTSDASSKVFLIAKTAGSNDSNLNIAIPGSLGVTAAATSGNTQTGSGASVTPGDNLSYITGTGPSEVFDAFGGVINGNSNGDTDPQFTAYTRNGSNFLTAINPAPAATSPLIGSGVSVAGGAPVAVDYRGAFAPGSNSNWAAGWTKLSQSDVLLGNAPTSGSDLADADGDGIADSLEATYANLGFNPAANDSSILGTLKTTAEFTANFTAGQNSVTSNPAAYSLYTPNSILDLRSKGQTIVQAGATKVNLSLPVQKSTGLNTWEPAGNLSLEIDKTSNKEFYRIMVEGAN